MTPSHCSHPACSRWTYSDYCSDECRGFTVSDGRGIGMVTPPHKVRVTAIRRVRRNEGFIVTGRSKFGGVWYAREPAPYLEFARDAQMGARSTTPRDTRRTAQSPAKERLRPGRIGRQEYHAPTNGGNLDA